MLRVALTQACRECLTLWSWLCRRPLKHHEQKLLRKVDFLQWKKERSAREMKVLRKYLVQNRDDYTKCVEALVLLSMPVLLVHVAAGACCCWWQCCWCWCCCPCCGCCACEMDKVPCP
jgi:hypothetical protein